MNRILKLNHILFRWYYKRVDKHFHQWTFFTSVKLLISNYEHDRLLLKNAHDHNRALINDMDVVRKELHNLKMQQIANPGVIDVLNKSFGTDYTNPNEN